MGGNGLGNLCSVRLTKETQAHKALPPMGIDSQPSHPRASLNIQGLIEGDGAVQSAGGDHGSGNSNVDVVLPYWRTTEIV